MLDLFQAGVAARIEKAFLATVLGTQ